MTGSYSYRLGRAPCTAHVCEFYGLAILLWGKSALFLLHASGCNLQIMLNSHHRTPLPISLPGFSQICPRDHLDKVFWDHKITPRPGANASCWCWYTSRDLRIHKTHKKTNVYRKHLTTREHVPAIHLTQRVISQQTFQPIYYCSWTAQSSKSWHLHEIL